MLNLAIAFLVLSTVLRPLLSFFKKQGDPAGVIATAFVGITASVMAILFAVISLIAILTGNMELLY